LNDRNVASANIRGSGPNGRIVAADLALASTSHRRALTPMRQAIARRTAESFAVPHFYLRAEVDATGLLARRAQVTENLQPGDVKITVTDFFLQAIGIALRQFPDANSIWRGDWIEVLDEASVGLVVALPEGLLIPVLRRVDHLSLAELARLRSTLAREARSGGLSPEKTRGAAASFSNLGNSRVDEFSPILAPEQTTMLAIGRIAPRPFAVGNVLEVRPTAKLTLAVDHRVLDGERASKYFGCLIEALDYPPPHPSAPDERTLSR
jgi:pyruvate dehydrogenase E2 component (dihydrolipoamide acetyltransferase)